MPGSLQRARLVLGCLGLRPWPEQMLGPCGHRKTRLVANPQNSCASCRSKQEGKMSELEENRLLDSEFQTISSEPLIGRLNLETDLGTIDLW